MADEFVSVTSESWFGRMADSFKSVLVGALLMVLIPCLLFWNEGRAVRTAQGLAEGAASVVDVKPDAPDPAHDAHLVHVTGEATTTEKLTDEQFGISVTALRLRREVEMYQWKESKQSETHKKLGGGTETVTKYTYAKEWSSSHNDSSQFKEQADHANPAEFPYSSKDLAASSVTLGGFTLSSSQVSQLSDFKPIAVNDAAVQALPEATRSKAKVADNRFVFADDPAHPKIGDARVSFGAVAPLTVSVIAKQTGHGFEPYPTKAGTKIDIIKAGASSAAEMFKSEQEANEMLTWIIRVGGFIFLWIAVAMVFSPISTFGDVIPFFGSILGAGVGLFSMVLAASISLVVIAIAWIAYRPVLGVGLLAATIALVFAAKSAGGKKAAA